MKLKEYLEKEKITYEAFAKQINTSKQVIWSYVIGGVKPQLPMFVKIYTATKRQVGLKDWFTDREIQELEMELTTEVLTDKN